MQQVQGSFSGPQGRLSWLLRSKPGGWAGVANKSPPTLEIFSRGKKKRLEFCEFQIFIGKRLCSRCQVMDGEHELFPKKSLGFLVSLKSLQDYQTNSASQSAGRQPTTGHFSKPRTTGTPSVPHLMSAVQYLFVWTLTCLHD